MATFIKVGSGLGFRFGVRAWRVRAPYQLFLVPRVSIRGGWILHAPIHKESNLGTGPRKLVGSSVITYRS